MKYFSEYCGETYNLTFEATTYQNNGSLAVQAYDEEGMPFAIVTVNTPYSDTNEKDVAFLDTNNSGSLVRQMVDDGLIELTGRYVQSGYCSYPQGKFTKKFYESEVKICR